MISAYIQIEHRNSDKVVKKLRKIGNILTKLHFSTHMAEQVSKLHFTIWNDSAHKNQLSCSI